METLVFGSNLAGHHFGGSAREAFASHGAVWGCGTGPQGASYAIPTLDEYLVPLSLDRISIHVNNFLAYAEANAGITFKIVAIGCGVAGFKPEQIAPMFKDAPSNCVLPEGFLS